MGFPNRQISLAGVTDRALIAVFQAIIAVLSDLANAVTGADDGPWTDVVFANGWSNFGSTYAHCQYRMEVNGRVRLRGLATGGSLGAVAFTLPAGFRPDHSVLVPSLANFTAGFVQIDSNGNVTIGGGSNTSNTLDGITFAQVN